MKEIIAFLRDLQQNNNREWFNAHKALYWEVQARFNRIVEELISEIVQFDETVAGLSARDCTYRIYRDVRFSDDKSPYKTHLGAYICRGGKKSGYSGYYFQISAGRGDSYPDSHMLATGDYCCQPDVLRILREDIMDGDGDFEQTLKAAPAFELDYEGSLKRNPKGFPADAPYSHYLRLKKFCLYKNLDEEFICSADYVHRMAMLFRTTYPFLSYVNRAIAFVKNG